MLGPVRVDVRPNQAQVQPGQGQAGEATRTKEETMKTDADTADALAMHWITQNPGTQGDGMPSSVTACLKSLQQRGLIIYSKRNGWTKR
jgi:pyridoxine/pyridoxamine 5'-phosphate oxidase